MRLLIVTVMILMIMPSAEALMTDVFEIELSYDNGKIEQESIELIKNYMPLEKRFEGDSYSIKAISFAGKILWSSEFSFPLESLSQPDISCYDEELNYDPENCVTVSYEKLESANMIVHVPYYPGANKIIVENSAGRRMLSIDLVLYHCGNGVCDTHEDIGSCPEDCDPDKQITLEVIKPVEYAIYLPYLLVVALIIGIAAVIVMYRRTRSTVDLPDVGQF